MIVLVVLAVLAPSAVSTSTASAYRYKESGRLSSEFSVKGTKGYRVRVTGILENEVPSVYIAASRGSAGVTYSARALATESGEIKAKLPGVGRIAVRFEPRKVSYLPAPDNCKGRGAVVRHGFFRGTILIHGENGYTKVDRESARGTITRTFDMVCRQGGGRQPAAEGGAALVAERQTGRRAITFIAEETNLGPLSRDSMTIVVMSFTRRHGYSVFADRLVQVKSDAFSIVGIKPPEEVVLQPPSPFHGSATFHLESKTSSTWLGDLSVALPGMEAVRLAGPGFQSELCEGRRCVGSEAGSGTVIIGIGSGQGRRLTQ